MSQDHRKLPFLLGMKFPSTSIKDGRWVFKNNENDIDSVTSQLLSHLYPQLNFLKVKLTNYLGYHINSSTCLVIQNRISNDFELIKPLWYSDIGNEFENVFIGTELKDSITVKEFIKEIQQLLLIGSSNGKFENLNILSPKITFDLVISTGTDKRIWRKFELFISDFTVIKMNELYP